MRIFADTPETLARCWPKLNFCPAARSGIPPWLDAFAAPFVRAWEFPRPLPFWDSGLIVPWAESSQYDLLRGLDPEIAAKAGNLACVALAGTGFHGQGQRKWQALAGNLHLCLKVNLDLPAADCSRPLVMLPAVAVMDVLALAGLQGPDLGIKWVNDILVTGRKLAGVLTSSRSVSGRLVGAVFGLGFNLTAAPDKQTTCLEEHWPGRGIRLGPLLELFLAAVAARVTELQTEGPGPVIQAYRDNSLILGRKVAIEPDDLSRQGIADGNPRVGRVLEIRPDLSLRLEGDARPVTSGRLTILDQIS